MKELHQPRFVLVTRKTPLEQLVEKHGTKGQAFFYLESRQQSPERYQEAHDRLTLGVTSVLEGIPEDRRRLRIDRRDLDRFLFGPDDIVLVVGQDGLVANTSKYLDGQLTLGVNPDPDRYDGVLCAHPPSTVPDFIRWLDRGKPKTPFRIEARIMAQATREDGQRILALNEIFVGHKSHQSRPVSNRSCGCDRTPLLLRADLFHRHRMHRLGALNLRATRTPGPSTRTRVCQTRLVGSRALPLGLHRHRDDFRSIQRTRDDSDPVRNGI